MNCLVIPDIHQHIAWAEAILSRESDQVQRVVFLGDYFDPKVPRAASVDETAQFISSLSSNYPELDFNFLVGNHDLPYLYGLQNPSAGFNPYLNGAYDETHLASLQTSLSQSFRQCLQPFVSLGDFLLSHAGLHRSFLPEGPLTQVHLDNLSAKLTPQMVRLPSEPTPELASVGFSRGGTSPVGGLTWQDWHQEFEDSLPWIQIVGHTILESPRKKGRSWNLDTRSGAYGFIAKGKLSIKELQK